MIHVSICAESLADVAVCLRILDWVSPQGAYNVSSLRHEYVSACSVPAHSSSACRT